LSIRQQKRAAKASEGEGEAEKGALLGKTKGGQGNPAKTWKRAHGGAQGEGVTRAAHGIKHDHL